MRREFPAWISPVVLAGVVLAVFIPLQNYGPQNAVRRFHYAVQEVGPGGQLLPEAEAELNRVTSEEPGDPFRTNLVTLTQRLLMNARPSLLGTERADREVWVAVVYRSRVNPSVVFVVKQSESGRWRVDCERTMLILANAKPR